MINKYGEIVRDEKPPWRWYKDFYFWWGLFCITFLIVAYFATSLKT